jgi:predicted GIY-YIG superfamily endonuclease
MQELTKAAKSGCYLLHFEQPICSTKYYIDENGVGHGHTTQHYLGWSDDVPARIQAHRDGRGARLTEVAKERGIGFEVVRTWDGEDRHFERALKNQKNSPRLCPICQPESVDRYMEREVKN